MAKVLLIGSGGREHALGWKLAQSPHVSEVLYAPGNGGTARGKGRNIPLSAGKKEQFPALAALIREEEMDLTVVGPEGPLAEGVVDFLHQEGIQAVFGPSQEATRLESDKFYSFSRMEQLGLPQAQGACCTRYEEALDAIGRYSSEGGVVLKARGLTGGKGVRVCSSAAEARESLGDHIERYGPHILVSQRLQGPEFSVFALSDGERLCPIASSFQDHKALLDGDRGPNTGGMGAYGPAPIAPPERVQQVVGEVMAPLVAALQAEQTPYRGFLYAGMMLTDEGPKVLEFNVRFGDPECQPAMVLLCSDLYPLLWQAAHAKLEETSLSYHPGAACCVVVAARGYPGKVPTGLPLPELDLPHHEGVTIFHAATTRQEGSLLSAGGRILGVTGYSPLGLAQAQQRAYQAIKTLHLSDDFYYRTDIASKTLPAPQAS